jgi:hypothetical protein
MTDEGLVFRKLEMHDIDALISVHQAVLASLADPSFLYARPDDFFERVLAGDGMGFGAFTPAGRLIAYSTLLRPNARDYPYLALDHLSLDASLVAHGTGMAVHPEFRAQRIMGPLLQSRTSQALAIGARFVTAVISPGNTPSLKTVHACGYFPVGVHDDDDGANYLALTSVSGNLRVPDAGDMDHAFDDHARNLPALASGRFIGLPFMAGDARMLRFVAASRLKDCLQEPEAAPARTG